jgi:hypothetical protein
MTSLVDMGFDTISIEPYRKKINRLWPAALSWRLTKLRLYRSAEKCCPNVDDFNFFLRIGISVPAIMGFVKLLDEVLVQWNSELIRLPSIPHVHKIANYNFAFTESLGA